jgi:DNA-binding MarR family transcriptional regulator
MRLLWRIQHGLQSTSKRMETTLGVTGPQRLVLKIVDSFPDLTARDLSGIVRLHPSTLTGVLRRLEVKGLIGRIRDTDDSRRVRLRVRPAARKFTHRAGGTIESAVQGALERLPAAKVRASRAVLAAVAEALEQTSSLPDTGRSRSTPISR